MKRFAFLATLVAVAPLAAFAAEDAPRPNILWLSSEDNGQELGCYGDEYAVTPNIDAFAKTALRYKNCWSNAPVCAPARTTIITGMYAPSLGAEHMRSLVKLPPDMKLFPQYLRAAGYYCTNNSKEDYNVEQPGQVWDESGRKAHYKNRQDGQPFFAVFNSTISHESKIRVRPHTLKHDPAQAPVPKYHPDTPTVRRDWAQYYDKLTEMDAIVGRQLAELEAAGLAEDTVVFYWGDHGSGMPRSKRWPYDSGLRVPLIVRVPEKFKHLAPEDYLPGGLSERMVAFVDFAPTVLSLAGVEIPGFMQGSAFAGTAIGEPRKYNYGYRGRMDERYDFVRSITDGRHVLIQNFNAHEPYGQFIEYMFQTPTTREWKELYDAGKLNEAQSVFWQPKAPLELYDLEADPDEVNNLIPSDPGKLIATMRANPIAQNLSRAQIDWIMAIQDTGFIPEPLLHSLAEETESGSIREYSADAENYSAIHAANLAGESFGAEAAMTAMPKPARERYRQRFVLGTGSENPLDRYWRVYGLWMIGSKLVGEPVMLDEKEVAAIVVALDDEVPAVAIVAAEAILELGLKEDVPLARQTLLKYADHREHGPWNALMAVNAIEAFMLPLAPAEAETLAAIPRQDKSLPGRLQNYLLRVREHIAELESQTAAEGE